MRGEVIGINTAIYTDSRQQGNIGIGFAIPINSVRELLPQLRTGKITRGVIGVQVTPVPVEALAEFGLKERRGALVSVVTRGAAAAKAGVEPGDIIVEFNGKPMKNRDELVATVVATRPGIDGAGQGAARQPGEDAQRHRRANSTSTKRAIARAATRETAVEPDEQSSQGFGITLTQLTSELARACACRPTPRACWSPMSSKAALRSARA